MNGRQNIQRQLTGILNTIKGDDLCQSAQSFWNCLGYESKRRLHKQDYTFDEYISTFSEIHQIKPDKALSNHWNRFCILFQLTGQELGDAKYIQMNCIADREYGKNDYNSYLFAAIDLTKDHCNRTELANLTREINRCFAMPLILLIKHGSSITISVIYRRISKQDRNKDVLDKVTLIKDINLTRPHRAHLEILYDLSFPALAQTHDIHGFADLHRAWEMTLDLKELNRKFYRELSNWFFWAVSQVEFPDGEETDQNKRNAIGVIRLLTRLIFIWFMKEKGLIPEALFEKNEIDKIINCSDPKNSSYYKAILQNLFFAVLNTDMNKDTPNSRRFRTKITGKLNPDYNYHGALRYESLFKEPSTALTEYFEGIPFLNGGLFECLDAEVNIEGRIEQIRIDGFSDRPDNVLSIPDKLFFLDTDQEVDLNQSYGTKDRRYAVTGLLNILHRYKFTVAENTPIEEEVALDPELLGRVFENLLAAYNPETQETARRETGSFYTPRDIVDLMVNESLIMYLRNKMYPDNVKKTEDLELRLRLMFEYAEDEHLFSETECDELINHINQCKIIDPACGSGAFLMGLLHKIVYVLHKIDPQNKKWKQRQIDKINETISDAQRYEDQKVADEVIAKLHESIKDINETFDEYDFDFSRKLFLIENCIYGVDIQPIAIQIAKLRFFISLLVEQNPKPDMPNLGIRSLPNLETNLIAANSLIKERFIDQVEIWQDNVFELVDQYKRDLRQLHRDHFTARSRKAKLDLRIKEHDLRHSFAQKLETNKALSHQSADQVAAWDPYASNASAEFFAPDIMFGFHGFDIVIANPPYVRQEKITYKAQIKDSDYQTYCSTADLYTYFLELSWHLLNPDGISAYITSNKWMRAAYGETLRSFLAQNTAIHQIIDFDGYRVFTSATVDTAILIFFKNPPPEGNVFHFVEIPATWDNTSMTDWIYSNLTQTKQCFFDKRGWVLAPEKILNLKIKIENAGKPLKNCGVSINYGVKTGFNDAFIIDTAIKERLCADDPNSIEILKPVLRGRDIARYHYNWAGYWLITTFPALHIDIAQYPAIKTHLESFGKRKLEQSGKSYPDGVKARKKTGNKWFETQDQIAYYDLFEEDYITYPIISIAPSFAYNSHNLLVNDKAFIITGKNLKFLLAVLNSTLAKFVFKHLNAKLGRDGMEFRKIFVEQFPIPHADECAIRKLSDHATTMSDLLSGANSNEELVSNIAKEIDHIVYDLYGLDKDDVSIIEGA